MPNTVNLRVADNADESFSLRATFEGVTPPEVEDVAIEIDVRASADSETTLATLSTSNGAVGFAASQPSGAIDFTITFAEGLLDPGLYVYDLIATYDGEKHRWFAGTVRVLDGVTA